MSATVVIVQESLPQYRIDLFAEICRQARDQGINVRVVHGRAPGERGDRLAGGHLAGALVIRNRYVRVPVAKNAAVWQPALRACLGADLVVVEQANRLLLNYVLLLGQRLGGPKVAFWGHGRNLQASDTSLAERVKARVATAPWWWFAYTSGVAERLTNLGVPRSRIAVVGNTIDVENLAEAVRRCRVADPNTSTLRCAYVGGLYSHKRLDLLFSAADLIAEALPGFELHIAGAGELRDDVERYAQDRPWVTYAGPVTGEARAALLASARLLLVPGLVGLVLLDSFAAGVPLVTTADALHSPEIEYLENGVNGVIIPPGAGPDEYATVAVNLLCDDPAWQTLREGAKCSAKNHSLSAAAERFVDGIWGALEGERELRMTPAKGSRGSSPTVTSARRAAGAESPARSVRIIQEALPLARARIIDVFHKVRRKLLQKVIRALFLKHPQGELIRLGSDYGGWWVPTTWLTPGTTVLSVGVGEDTTFDEELLTRGCDVWALDPTPRAATYVAARGLESGQYSDRFHFWPIGLWDRTERLRFYAPANDAHVSHSIVNIQKTSKWFEAECLPIDEVLTRAHLDRLDLVKLDIEGAEFRVLDHMLSKGILPQVLCVEIDAPLPELRTIRLLRQLQRCGYRLSKAEQWNLLLTRDSPRYVRC